MDLLIHIEDADSVLSSSTQDSEVWHLLKGFIVSINRSKGQHCRNSSDLKPAPLSVSKNSMRTRKFPLLTQ